MRNAAHIILGFLTLAALFLGGRFFLANDQSPGPATDYRARRFDPRPMPEFSLLSLAEDVPMTSDTLRGSVLLISFFATWCRSCLEEIPMLNSLQARFSKEGFAVIGMAVGEGDHKGIKPALEKLDINYQVLLSNEAVQKSFGGVTILPTMFLVNKKGTILNKYAGHIPRDSLARNIESAFEG